MPVVPPRGIIYDRNHVVLAENSPVYHLVMYPNRQINTEKTIRSLSKLLELGLSEKEIKRLKTSFLAPSEELNRLLEENGTARCRVTVSAAQDDVTVALP